MADYCTLSKEISGLYTLADYAFIREAKNDPADRIEVEVGDVHDPKFRPQVKIKRWDNDVNLSVRLQTDGLTVAVVSTDKKKIKWRKGNLEVHFYEIGPSELHHEGGYELEITLRKEPKTNRIAFSLQSKGLRFCYQPPLTQEELDQGNFRPERVVGSYAVYHESHRGDWSALGGMNYRCGKACHIYRPKATDANGKAIYGDLAIDQAAGTLSITVDSTWLAAASYPVRIRGTEFGYTSLGGTAANVVDFGPYRGQYQISEDATGVSMSVGMSTTGVPHYRDAKCALYIGANVIANGETSEVNQYFAGKAWEVFPFPVAPTLVALTDYWLAVAVDSEGVSSVDLWYDTDGGAYGYDTTVYASCFPDPWSDDGSGARLISIYCTYATPGPVERRITQLVVEVDQVQDSDRRITQLLAEIDQDATEERRATQLLLEVDYEEEEKPETNMFEIDEVEYKTYLDLDTLEVTEGLEPHGDTCTFVVTIPNILIPDTIDRPKSGNPILIRVGEIIHFKGIIGIVTEDPINPDITRYHCECTDFTRWLDRKLITVERGAELAGDRIKALVAWIRIDLSPFPFGTTHVENGFTVAAETYDYVPLSSILDEVSEACHYQWYVDFDKEIHFFALEENPSPLNVSYGNELDLDDTGNLDVGGVVVTEDATQIKNRVYVKGYSEKGDILYKDGPYPNIANQSFYKLYQEPWDWENTEVEVDGEETLEGLDHGTRIVRLDPLDGATETLVGREGEAFVCLFNMGMRFPTTDLPAGDVTAWYYPAMPDQISMYEDIYSIEFMADRENSSGVHEFMISVPSLRVSSIDPVEAMGEYLLQRYAWPFRSGSFATYTLTGWKPGQYFLLTSDAKDLYDYQDFWKSGKTEKNPIIMYVLHVTKHFFEVSDGVGGVTELVRETVEFANQPYPL